jgi:hypothetical protein
MGDRVTAPQRLEEGRELSGWLFGLQLPDHLERVVDVLADVGH